jgi:transposase, IS30 family
VREGVSPMGNRLGQADRLEILERVCAGETQPQIARALGTTTRTVRRVLAAAGGAPSRRSRRRPRSSLRLSLSEREEIRAGIAAGDSFRAIARRIGRAPSTVSREAGGVWGRSRYRATVADDRACLAALRPKPSKLASSPRLRRAVVEMLECRFSPQQISARLRLEHPDDAEMRIAPETIYQSLYVQSRGRLRKDLTRYLRSGRSKRKPRRGPSGQGRLRDMVSISQRPAEVRDRAVPGHWEGDLIVGKQNRSFIGTLVERQTRYLLLTYLGNDASTETVTAMIAEQIGRLPEQLRLSLTWDQGREMARHLEFTIATAVKVYFCDPRSPWQRGSNENTNGLLRQYFPKGTDLAAHEQTELDRVAAELNRRPRQTLGWQTPAEKMAELLR